MLLKRLHLINYIQCSISIFFICTGKQTKGVTHFCDICCMAVVWNQTRGISYVCLYWTGLMERIFTSSAIMVLFVKQVLLHSSKMIFSNSQDFLRKISSARNEWFSSFYHATFFFFKILVVFPQTWHCTEAFLRRNSSVFLSASVSKGSSICFSYPHACPLLIWMWEELITMLVTFF